MGNIIEVEKDQVCATVRIHAREVDASFSHAFGIEKVIEIEIIHSEILSYELWSEDFDKIVSKAPTRAESKWIKEKAEEDFLAGF